MSRRLAVAILAAFLAARPAAAQQRPLVTQDPESIGAGHILLEGGIEYADDVTYTVSGLKGNTWTVPSLGFIFGLSSIAELQITFSPFVHMDVNSRFDAPLSSAVTFTGDTTHDVEDAVVATKIRVLSETAGRPSFGIRFATRLPNASNQSGLGLDTTDFYMSALVAKTVQSVRLVGNVGFGILGAPTIPNEQNDVLTYGVSFARALTTGTELVGEVNGRVNTRPTALPGTESRGILKVGGRYTHGALRLDAAMLVGLTSIDPTIGFTGGFTYVFNAFNVP